MTSQEIKDGDQKEEIQVENPFQSPNYTGNPEGGAGYGISQSQQESLEDKNVNQLTGEADGLKSNV